MFGHQKAISAALATAYSVAACDPTQGFTDACVCGHNPKVNCEDLARRGNSTDTFAAEQCCSDLNMNGCSMDAYGRVHEDLDSEDGLDWYSLMQDFTAWGGAKSRTSTWADATSKPEDAPELKQMSTWADAPEEDFSLDSDDEFLPMSYPKSTWADAPLGFSTYAPKSTWADAPKIDLASMDSNWNTLLGAVNKANQKVQGLRSGGLAAAEAYAKELEEREAEAASGWPLDHSLPPFTQGKSAQQNLARGGLAGAQAMLAQLEQQEQMRNARSQSCVDSRSTEL